MGDLSQCETYSPRSCRQPRPGAIDWLGNGGSPLPCYAGVYCARSAGMLTGRSVRREAGHDPARRRNYRRLVAGPISRHWQLDVRTDGQWIFTAAKVGGGISLPVGKLVLTVAVLQLLPFAVGLALRKWTPETATQWRAPALQISNLSLVAVLALSLLGSWQQIIALIGSLTLLAALIFNVVAFGIGTLVATGSRVTRTTVGLLAPVRNAGPVFAAVAIAFNNDPNILGALTGILILGLAVSLLLASYLARHRSAPEIGVEPKAGVEPRVPATGRTPQSKGSAP